MKSVHPFADTFPMMDAERLKELADSIIRHGLDYPITLDQQGQLLDGRNRLAACKLAGVTPRYETKTVTEEEALDLIYRRNTQRRDISEGARAMAFVIRHPDKNPDLTANDPNPPIITKARTVLREFGMKSDAVRDVMSGGSIRDAYSAAKEMKRERESLVLQLQQLRLTHPELAAHVDAGEWTLRQAHAEIEITEARKLRAEEIAQQRKVLADAVATVTLPVYETFTFEGEEPYTTLREELEPFVDIENEILEQQLGVVIHPYLAIFPLMPMYQLADMADSIRRHGLIRPIWRDRNGVILDGRCRLLACQQAGVEPTFRTYEGADDDDQKKKKFIFDVNCSWGREMNRSKRAMYHALLDTQSGEVEPSADEYVDIARRVVAEFGKDSDIVQNIMKGGSLAKIKNMLDQIDQLKEKVE